jgi:hypothetical protein
MVTFFTTAKPSFGHHGIIRRNALKSWRLLHPDVEAILFGDDEGAEQTTADLGLCYEPRVESNEFGTKQLDSLFSRAQRIARHDLLCFIHCDIILMQDFCEALKVVCEAHAQFLMVGRRWDAEISRLLDFLSRIWELRLRLFLLREGKRRTP